MNRIISAIHAWWQARLPREQRILAAGGTIALLVIWIGFILLPLSAEVSRLKGELPDLRKTNASLEAMASEAQGLHAAAPATAVPPNEREAAISHSLAHASLGDARNIQVQLIDTAHVRVHCDDTDYGQWLAWVYGTSEDTGAHVASATVTSRATVGFTGHVKADVVFAFDAGRGSGS